ncbi:hypothetical protein [Streptomyces sp. NBC_00670]|uniref:hypothetical protein n=1 Tax=Streptomyces sp. NBC_00670 TaxID=2975804 RepID=UPI002E325AF3|nr:hypothetical protein [Streptomyces sp. NBC_00670]
MKGRDVTTPDPYEVKARMLRAVAAAGRVLAAQIDVAANAVLATQSMRAWAAAMTTSEAHEVAAHPDLAELNVQMDGFYGPYEP